MHLPPVLDMNQTYLSANPSGLGEILDRAFRLYRAYFAKLILTASTILVPIYVVIAITSGQIYRPFLQSNSGLLDVAGPETITPDLLLVAFSMLQALIMLLALAVVSLALVWQCAELIHGRIHDTRTNLRAGLGRLLPFIGLTILQGLIGLIFALFILIPCIGIILLLIGIAFFYTRLIVTRIDLVIESNGPITAINQSWFLTRGQFWRCLGMLLLLGILQFLILSLPGILINTGSMAFIRPDQFWIVTSLSTVIQGLAQIIWVPLNAATLVFFYYDLRVRRQDFGLELRLEQLEDEISNSDDEDTGSYPMQTDDSAV